MKVKDLIKELEKYNEELEVLFSVENNDWGVLLFPCDPPKLISAVPHPNIIKTKEYTIYTYLSNKEEQAVTEFLLLT